MTRAVRLRAAAGPPPLTAEVEWGSAYEALLGLSMFTGDEPEPSYDVGVGWFRQARKLSSVQLRSAIRRLLGSAGQQWFLLLGLAHAAPAGRRTVDLLAHVASLPPREVQSTLLGSHLPNLRTEAGRTLLAAALDGDRQATAAVATRCADSDARVVRRVTAMAADQVKALLVDILERWDREVFTPLGGAADDVLEADVTTRRRMAARLGAARLVEAVADGMRYRGEAGIDSVRLIPSVISRPFITISEWDSTKLICYQAAQLSHGSGAPQPDMVAVYRALGDDTRLRILRELAGGDRRIAGLTQKLGLAKSTVHAHLVVLRAAGLVRVNIGPDKAYGLRDAVPDLNRLLRDYLGT